MKKTVAVVVFLFIVAVSGAFGQTTADEWFKKGNEYRYKSDHANAITAYSEAIKRGSTDLDAYWFRSISYYLINNYDAAMSDWNKVIKEAPYFSNVYLYRGDVYSKIKNYDAAISDFTTYLEKEAKPSSDSYIRRGYVYGAKGIYHKAVADYRTGLEKGYDPSGFYVDKSDKSDMWFCGAMYMEILVNRFLGKSDVVAKYENWLKTVSDKNKVTRQEIEAFYRDNIRGLISAVVDEEFNKISFTMSNDTIRKGYNVVLTRTADNQYILEYEGVYQGKEFHAKLPVVPLETLLVKMRGDTENFDRSCVDTVKAQAALIPAAALSDAALRDVKTYLTAFYTNPGTGTYKETGSVLWLYANMSNRVVFRPIVDAYMKTLTSLSQELVRKINSDSGLLGSNLTREQQQRLTELR